MSKELEKYIKKNYPIQTWMNNKILRTKSEPVKEITQEIREFADILYAWMELYDGVWLAAPQIGVNLRMIAICQLNKKEDKIISSWVLINPEIIEKSEQTMIEKEWCLSLPWLEWSVKRFKKIKVKYLDLDWKKHEMNLHGINAGIIQHEMDHLDGVLFWDKVLEKDRAVDFGKLLQF